MSINLLTFSDIEKCSGKRLSIDTETTGLQWYKNHMIGFGIYCPDADVGGYMPTDTDEERRNVRIALMDLLSSETTVIAHNLKFDFHFLGISPRECKWNVLDTAILVHLMDSRFRKSAESLEKNFLGTNTKKEFMLKGGRNKIWNWSLDLIAPYCENDCRIEYEFAKIFTPEVVELGLWKLFLKDMEYLKDIWDIERHGIILDKSYITTCMIFQENIISEMEQHLYDAVGYEFNWRSTKQLSEALYASLGIPKPKNPFADADGVDRSRFADGGLYKSTCTSSFLLMEKVKHPLGSLIGSLRESARLLKTVETYLVQTDDDDIVHTGFNITGTRTGRLSSSKPNMQNVPSGIRGRFTQSVYSGDTSRSDEYNLRKAFVAREGKTFLSIDWKQMEMRMFGILSQDPFMLKSLKAGKDVHGDIADKVWHTRDHTHREWSKTISFGLIYGMTLGSLMFKLNMTKAQASVVCDQYWAEFPRIKPWLNEIIEQVRKFGFVRYWSGRLWREENPIDAYKGANAQIQGGCADLLSIAELRAAKWCRDQGDTHKIVNLVHDEIIIELPDEDVQRASREVSKLMEVPDLFNIPFITDSKAGKSYGDLHEF